MSPLGIGFNTIKRSMKGVAGRMAALTVPFLTPSSGTQGCIFVYHRLAEIGFVDPNEDDWNVSPAVFERQITELMGHVEFVRLPDLLKRIHSPQKSDKPLVCLTFDDGYASFYSHALPVLQQYSIPATVFVVTAFIGRWNPMPFDRWTRKIGIQASSAMWRPMNWSEIEDCLDTGLVTIGAHSHEHLSGRSCSRMQMRDEVELSRDILLKRLGEPNSQMYSYPYGSTRLGHVPSAYVQVVKDAGYALAVCTDLGMVDASSDPFLLPRIEAHSVDSGAVMRAKSLGALLPYRLTDRLRMSNRGV